MKKMRFAIAALAVVALVGVTTAEVMAGPGCGGKTTTKASSSCGSKASATKADAKAGCAATCTDAQKAAAGCASSCAKATKTASACSDDCVKACCAGKTAMKACNYTEAQCASYMHDRYKSHGWLGIEMNMDGDMPVLTRVADGSPAQKGGFQVGDVLTSVNGIGFSKANESVLNEMYKNGFKIGQEVVYTANRDGSIVTLNAKLTKISDTALAQMITGHNQGYTHKATDQAENIGS